MLKDIKEFVEHKVREKIKRSSIEIGQTLSNINRKHWKFKSTVKSTISVKEVTTNQ